jgi:broad specificity phosphatase PhoE
MTRLLLLRHGFTDWNAEGRYQGQADPPLNAAGREQADCLAERLAGRGILAIYSSDLQRARQTAEIVSRKLGLCVSVDRHLREISQGEWEGMLVAEIISHYPAEWSRREVDPTCFSPPGGESVLQVARRLRQTADEIARQHPAGSVLVISHGLAIATLRCQACGLPLERAFEMIPENIEPVEVDWPPA